MNQKIVKRSELGSKLGEEEVPSTTEADFLSVGSPIVRKDVQEAIGEAKKIINEAQKEAGLIRKEAESIRAKVQQEMEAAKEKGYLEGKNSGLNEAGELLVAAKALKEKMFHDLEPELVRLAYDIAEKVLGNELSKKETALIDLIRQALRASLGEKITLLVNPADFEWVRQNQPQLSQTLDTLSTLQIRASDRVAAKGCIIESELGTIDAQLKTQLEAIGKALGFVE